MKVRFEAICDEGPGAAWQSAFRRLWPQYSGWWLKEGAENRASYLEGRLALQLHMPELVSLYDDLCELSGGGDLAARFLSFWCPPPYLAGCSQAIWPGTEAMLVRNYDYDPHAFDAVVLRTEWLGRSVLGMSDGMWGLVDGINDAGLVVSLTFGGRRIVGDGFGVPLILRYVLQTCETTAEAEAVLRRIPCHMSYNVTVVDAQRRYLTAYLSPDRGTAITHAAAATNHQERVEWSSHARFTATVQRERFLLQRLTLHTEPQEKFIDAFLKPPLYSIAFSAGFGTLYTAVYHAAQRRLELRWPGLRWRLLLDDEVTGARYIQYPNAS